jgi:murein biosynthesis integral membrane protein MurJ
MRVLKGLFLSALILNVGLLLGRLSGFVREAFVAAAYGATADADIVILMLTVPDLLVNILVGGALGAVLIPEFGKYPKLARKLLYQSMLLGTSLFVIITLILYLQAELLVSVIMPGFSQDQVFQGARVLSRVLWLIPLTVLAGIVTAYLHSQNKFAVAAMGTLIVNVTIITGLLLVHYGYGSLYLVAFFVLLGGVLRLISQLLQVDFAWSPISGLFPCQFNKEITIRYLQAMFSGGVLLLFPVVARAFASFEGDGSVAVFNYATRLIELPLAIAVTFLATVFFPRLSQSYSAEVELHRQQVKYGVQIVLVLSLVAMISLMISSEMYSRFVYGYGEMEEANLHNISRLVFIGLVALPFQGLSVFLTAVYNARLDTRTPLALNGIGLALFLLANNADLFGDNLEGIMWRMVVSYVVISIIQLFFLRIDGLSWVHVLLEKSFIFGVVCGCVVLFLGSYWVIKTYWPAWLILSFLFFLALLVLCLIALFNYELRCVLKTKLSNK